MQTPPGERGLRDSADQAHGQNCRRHVNGEAHAGTQRTAIVQESDRCDGGASGKQRRQKIPAQVIRQRNRQHPTEKGGNDRRPAAARGRS
jgi:hypothetical protein